MARPKKVVEVEIEEVDAGVTVVTVSQSSIKTIAMVRDESYPEPRSADVNIDAVDEWKTFGWKEK